MNIYKHPILNSIYNACVANEAFPASEKQTAQAILLGDIGNQVEKLVDALTAAESRIAALERDGERHQWIPILERLPAKADADCDGMVWIWAPNYTLDPNSRPDDDEPKYVYCGHRAWRDRWDWIRTQKPSHWMPSKFARPEGPAAQQADAATGKTEGGKS